MPLPGQPTPPKVQQKAPTSGAGYNPYAGGAQPQRTSGLAPTKTPTQAPQWQKQTPAWMQTESAPTWMPPQTTPAWMNPTQGPSPQTNQPLFQPSAGVQSPNSGANYNPYGNSAQTPWQWKPTDFQAPTWLGSNLGTTQYTPKNNTQPSGQNYNPYNPPSQGQLKLGQPTQGTGLNAINNPTSLSTATGVYGTAPWLIPGPQYNYASDPNSGGGGFGTRYKGWGGGGGGYGGGSGNSYPPPWYMNLYSWNYKG